MNPRFFAGVSRALIIHEILRIYEKTKLKSCVSIFYFFVCDSTIDASLHPSRVPFELQIRLPRCSAGRVTRVIKQQQHYPMDEEFPLLYLQTNSVDCGPIVLNDAVSIVQPKNLQSEWSCPTFRRCAAADVRLGHAHCMIKGKDPKRTYDNLVISIIQNKKVAVHSPTGIVLDDVAVTKGMLQRLTNNERLNTDCMNAALHLIRKEQPGPIKIAILDCYFNQRAEKSIKDNKVATDYLTWMKKEYGKDFDFSGLDSVWIPMYLPDPNEIDGEQAHWWRLIYNFKSCEFSRGCSLGNEKLYDDHEESAKIFLMRLLEVYLSVPFYLYSCVEEYA